MLMSTTLMTTGTMIILKIKTNPLMIRDGKITREPSVLPGIDSQIVGLLI